MKAANQNVDALKIYSLAEALPILKKNATAKFDETIDVAVNLGVDPKQADQNIHRTPAHVIGRLVDSGQRRIDKRRHFDVIKTDHGDIFRHPQPGFFNRMHGADGNIIIKTENRGRPLRQAQQMRYPGDAGFNGISTAGDLALLKRDLFFLQHTTDPG